MATLTLTNEQLRLVQTALDLYSRIGILQFWTILDHPTVYSQIIDRFTDPSPLKVGDSSLRGEVVELGKGYIKTRGNWGNGEDVRTWYDVDQVKRSPDWKKVHSVRDSIRQLGGRLAYQITGEDHYLGGNASFGIHHPGVDNSCREAFDIIQVIRHEFWKADPERSNITVDSSIHLTSDTNTRNVKAEIDPFEK